MTHNEDPLNTVNDDLELDDQMRNELNKSMSDLKGKIGTVRDQLKLKLHLAEMDADDFRHEIIDSLDHVNRKLQNFEQQVDQTRDKLDVQAHLGVMEAKQRWDATKKQANKVLQLLEKDADKAKQLIEEAKLQGSLAKLESKDLLSDVKSNLKENVHEWQKLSARTLKQLNESVGDFLGSLGRH